MMQLFKLLQRCSNVKSKQGRTFHLRSHLVKSVFPSLLLISLLILLLMTTTGMASPNLISTDNPLIIGGNKEFAPLEFLNSEGNPDGFAIEIMKAVAREKGLNIKFDLGLWSDARSDLKDGKIDAVSGMLYTKERDKVFDFSAPYVIITYMIFIRTGTPINSIDDLNGKEIIVVEDVHAHDWVTKNRITDSIITVNGATEALKLLASGKHDCVILPRLHGLER